MSWLGAVCNTTNVSVIWKFVNKQIVPCKDVYEQKFQFNQLGYKTKVQRRGYSYFLSINKLVALGNSIDKGKELFAYVGQDTFGRNMLVIYLDGFPKNNSQNKLLRENNSFLEE